VHTVAEALALLLADVAPLAPDEVALWDAHGRVLAHDLVAERDLPGFDDSAMDGLAVRSGDTPGELRVIGEVRAGRATARAPLGTGEAVRIMTGAPLPPGADAVVIREEVVEHERDGVVRAQVPATAAGANVRRRGDDVARGTCPLPAGTWLGPGELGMLAALGAARVAVCRRPTVAILATGDELIDVGAVPAPGERVDSSAHTLVAACREAGADATYLGVARDDLAEVTARVRAALACDVLLTTGGVSVGEADHVRPALAAAGAELRLWKVAMRPGKPLAFARAGATRCVGLPGNPVSTLVAFELFVRPLLRALGGHPAPGRPRAPVTLTEPYAKRAGRAHYVRARLRRDGDHLHATPLPHQGSGALSSMIGVDALVEIPAELTHLPRGGRADAVLLRPC
jgi:molybdopterin molybdotransferase